MIKNRIKITSLLTLAAVPAISLIAQQPPPPPPPPPVPTAEPAEILEAYGFYVGLQSGIRGFELSANEYKSFLKGLNRAQAGDPIPENLNEMMPQFQAYLGGRQMEINQKKSAKNRADGKKFFEGLKKKGVKSTESGLYYEIGKKGNGDSPDAGSTVRINYEGRLLDGTVFDSSIARNEPATFPLGNVIAGMREGIQLIQEGGKITLYIPADQAYGDNDGRIPPGSTLIFEVELLEVMDTPSEPAMPQFVPGPER